MSVLLSWTSLYAMAMLFQLANLLNRRRIPYVVQTGGGFPFRIKNEMPDALVFFKPVSSTRLVHYLLALAASRASAVRNAA